MKPFCLAIWLCFAFSAQGQRRASKPANIDRPDTSIHTFESSQTIDLLREFREIKRLYLPYNLLNLTPGLDHFKLSQECLAAIRQSRFVNLFNDSAVFYNDFKNDTVGTFTLYTVLDYSTDSAGNFDFLRGSSAYYFFLIATSQGNTYLLTYKWRTNKVMSIALVRKAYESSAKLFSYKNIQVENAYHSAITDISLTTTIEKVTLYIDNDGQIRIGDRKQSAYTIVK